MANEEEGTLVSESQIAVHWREEENFRPLPKFIGQANASDPSIFERFNEEHFPECFKEYADLLTWDHYWHTTLDTSNPPFWKWFVGGRLNACYNCVDRHLETSHNKAALIWVPEPETEETKAITYKELYVSTSVPKCQASLIMSTELRSRRVGSCCHGRLRHAHRDAAMLAVAVSPASAEP